MRTLLLLAAALVLAFLLDAFGWTCSPEDCPDLPFTLE